MNVDYQTLFEQFGCPFYLYGEEAIAGQLDLLKKSLPGFQLLYSIKTNPHPAICRFMAESGVGADAASSYEVKRALSAGIDRNLIVYSAPGKTAEELDSVLNDCLVTADSYSELELLDRLAGDRGIKLAVGLRVNPLLSYGPGLYPETLAGAAAKFGVDEETLIERRDFFSRLKNIRLAGLHIFLRSQILSPAAIAAAFERAFKIADFCRNTLDWDLSFINFGGGLGIAPAPGESPLDLTDLCGRISALVKQYKMEGVRLMVESGRFLVAESGLFVSRVADVKVSRGRIFVIAPGGLNGFLRPALMNLLRRIGYDGGPLEPLFSAPGNHQVSLPGKEGLPSVKVTVSGNLCTALDVLAEEVELPEPAVGDVLLVSNAGAYSASLSPFAFASFPRPSELYLKRDGQIELG